MKSIFFLITLFCFPFSDCIDYRMEMPDTAICISENEKSLADLINGYRTKHGLEAVTLSISLTEVAQLHVRDLIENKPFDQKGKCNMHSWSKNEKWSKCCYNSGADGDCMWDKPRELTQYKGDGYEIIMSQFNSQFPDMEVSADNALKAWKKSPRHNAVLLNKEIWKSTKWKAMGIGIHKGFAAVWFGKEIDTVGAPNDCTN